MAEPTGFRLIWLSRIVEESPRLSVSLWVDEAPLLPREVVSLLCWSGEGGGLEGGVEKFLELRTTLLSLDAGRDVWTD